MRLRSIILAITSCLTLGVEGCMQATPYVAKENDGTLYGLTLHVFRDELKAMREKEETWRSNPDVWKKILGEEQYELYINSFKFLANMDAREELIPAFTLKGYKSPRVTKELMRDIHAAIESPFPSYQKHVLFSGGWYSIREILIHEFLICAAECDMSQNYNKRIRSNESPLMLATVLGEIQIVKYLIDHGAMLNDISGEFYYQEYLHKKIRIHPGGETVLHYAAKSGQAEIYDYLIRISSSYGNK